MLLLRGTYQCYVARYSARLPPSYPPGLKQAPGLSGTVDTSLPHYEDGGQSVGEGCRPPKQQGVLECGSWGLSREPPKKHQEPFGPRIPEPPARASTRPSPITTGRSTRPSRPAWLPHGVGMPLTPDCAESLRRLPLVSTGTSRVYYYGGLISKPSLFFSLVVTRGRVLDSRDSRRRHVKPERSARVLTGSLA